MKYKIFFIFSICKKWQINIIKNTKEDSQKTQQTFLLMKRYWRRFSSSSSQDVYKTSWSRLIYSPYSYVFRRRPQDLFKTSWSILLYLSWSWVFKTSSRRPAKTYSRCLQYVFKTSCKNFFKTSATRLQDVLETSSRRLQDIFKTFSRQIIKLNCSW